MAISWLLKPHVSIVEDNGLLSLRDPNLTVHIPEVFGLDHETLKASREIKTAEHPFRDKVILKLHEADWLEISIGVGFSLQSVTLSVLHDLFKCESEDASVTVSQGLVFVSESQNVTAIAAKSKSKLSISHEKFPEFLKGEVSGSTKHALIRSGFYNHDETLPDLLAEAFHLSTVTTDVVENERYESPPAWQGQLSVEPKTAFEKILHSRKSSYDFQKSLSEVELRDFLKTFYSPQNGRVAYPSAGKMYAAQLRCVMPGGQVYSYNPLTDSLKNEGSAASISRPECVRVFVIGSTLQLQKKYRKIPYRLLLLEAGVILQQISLVAAALSYKGFINGMLEPNAESNLFLRDGEKLIAEYRLGQ